MKDLSDKGRHGDFVFYWQGIGNAGNKCLLVLISAPKLQIVLTQYLNLWRNVCSFKWLNFSHCLAFNITPIRPCIENNDLYFNMKNYTFELLERFKFTSEVSRVVPLPNTKRKERVLEAFCSVRKFFCLYLQFRFDN